MESTRLLQFHLFGIHLHVRHSSGRMFRIHQDASIPFVRNSPTRSSFIWQNVQSPPGCFNSFCSEFTYTFVIHLAECLESTRMLKFHLFGIHLHVRYSSGRMIGIHQDASIPFARNSPTRSSFIWQNVWYPPGCFNSFCSEFAYLFVLHLANYPESTVMFIPLSH